MTEPHTSDTRPRRELLRAIATLERELRDSDMDRYFALDRAEEVESELRFAEDALHELRTLIADVFRGVRDEAELEAAVR